jgi:hypothetical protein
MLAGSYAAGTQTRRHMGIKEAGYVVPSDGRAGERRRRRDGWLDSLRRWLVECPQCAEVWLIVGARDNDSHVCKECGHSFTIKVSVTTAERKSTPDIVAGGAAI